MSIPCLRRAAAWSAWVCLLNLAAGPLSADIVTLKRGPAVHGKVVTSHDPNAVTLQTAKGALIVFDRADVKSVQRAQSAAAAKKTQLTPQEKAWMAKVHSLVERANGPDPDRRRKAISDLLNVSDESAIPALTHYLAASPNAREREFYANVLRNIPGPKAVYFLVRLSMVDPAPAVREAARKAIGADRADLARPLYIQILKSGNPILASLAAKGIGEIGDPNGESVPYLIDAVVFRTSRVVATSQPQEVLDADRLAEITRQNQLIAQAEAAANAPPAAPVRKMQIRVGENLEANVQSMGGESSLGYAITGPPPMRPMSPPMFGSHDPEIRMPALITSAPVTLADIMNTAPRYSTGIVGENNVNPAVHDTLVQLTGQHFGSNVPNWRRFWANQLKNRALKEPKARDHVISKSPTP
jgi:hypothetical protein